MLFSSNNCFQKLDTNIGLRLEIMELGNPCILTTISTNNLVVLAAVKLVGSGPK